MKFKCYDRNYDDWEFLDEVNNKIDIDERVNPVELKLLTGDDICLKKGIISSPYRIKKQIPGVLACGGVSYGRSSNGKLYYRCLPNDVGLPIFLVPYSGKRNGFSKYFVNKFITFEFDKWIDKHPIGQVVNNFGDVDEHDSYYKYQLCCRTTNSVPGLKSLKTILKTLDEKSYDDLLSGLINNGKVEDRTKDCVFTIDPSGCQDFDDGFSVKYILDGYKVSIYISNVPLFLDQMNLWSILDDKITSIYLPDRIIPMLHNIISANMCSLKSNTSSIAVAMDITIKENRVFNVEYKNVLIKVLKNYVYEDEPLVNNIYYRRLRSIAEDLNRESKYLDEIKDSHDVVQYFMIYMNNHVAERLYEKGCGIYRTSVLKENIHSENIHSENIPNRVVKVIESCLNTQTKYVDRNSSIGHNMIRSGCRHYLHTTSPIRRVVDIVNLMELQRKCMGVEFGIDGILFLENTYAKIEVIDNRSREINRLQRDCNLYNNLVVKRDEIKSYYKGTVISIGKDKKDKKNKYQIYLSEINTLMNYKTTVEFEKYNEYKFRLHIFLDEVKLMNKIRISYMAN